MFCEGVEGEFAVDGEFVFADAVESLVFGAWGIEFVFDFADEFFEDVFEGDHADGGTEFVDDEGHVGAFGEEDFEEFVERLAFRGDDDVAADFGEVWFGFVDDAEEVLDVDDAEADIEVAFAEREARVFGLEGDAEIGVEFFAWVEGDDFSARGHDVASDEVIEFERVDGDVAFCWGDLFGAAGFFDEELEFFGAVDIGVIGVGVDFEDPAEELVSGAVEEEDGPAEDAFEACERGGYGNGGGEGAADGEGFRHEFTEDHMEEGEDAEGDDEGDNWDREPHRGAVWEDFPEGWLDEDLDVAFAEHAEGDAGHGDAELGGGEVVVEASDDAFGFEGFFAGVFFVDEFIDLAAAYFDDGELCGDEEAVEEDEEDDEADLPSDVGGVDMVPCFDDLVGSVGEESGEVEQRAHSMAGSPRSGVRPEGIGRGVERRAGRLLGSEFFVDAFIAAFEDGEPAGFGVGDGDGLGDFWGIDSGDEFADWFFAERADLERGAIDWAHEFEALGADPAGLFRVFGDVLVDGHGRLLFGWVR